MTCGRGREGGSLMDRVETIVMQACQKQGRQAVKGVISAVNATRGFI